MNAKIILGALVGISGLIISCKGESKADESQAPPKIAITLNAIVLKDDSFQVFFKEDTLSSTPFTEESSQYVEFKGSDKPQNIAFTLPEGFKAATIRFDFGVNRIQDPIIIKSLKIENNDKSLEIKGSDFFNYFEPNLATMTVNPEAATVKPIVPQQGFYDPMFTPTRKLIDALADLK